MLSDHHQRPTSVQCSLTNSTLPDLKKKKELLLCSPYMIQPLSTPTRRTTLTRNVLLTECSGKIPSSSQRSHRQIHPLISNLKPPSAATTAKIQPIHTRQRCHHTTIPGHTFIDTSMLPKSRGTSTDPTLSEPHLNLEMDCKERRKEGYMKKMNSGPY